MYNIWISSVDGGTWPSCFNLQRFFSPSLWYIPCALPARTFGVEQTGLPLHSGKSSSRIRAPRRLCARGEDCWFERFTSIRAYAGHVRDVGVYLSNLLAENKNKHKSRMPADSTQRRTGLVPRLPETQRNCNARRRYHIGCVSEPTNVYST